MLVNELIIVLEGALYKASRVLIKKIITKKEKTLVLSMSNETIKKEKPDIISIKTIILWGFNFILIAWPNIEKRTFGKTENNVNNEVSVKLLVFSKKYIGTTKKNIESPK
jgi:hypothetical protein